MSISFKREQFQVNPAKTPREEMVSFRIQALAKGEDTALDSTKRMVYVVRQLDKKIIYVGEAKNNLKKRLQRGFIAYRRRKRLEKKKRGPLEKSRKKLNGYSGYKWIELFDKKNKPINPLLVEAFIFDHSYDNLREVIEAIEAELVFLIRQKEGEWPIYQNEIHFNNQKGAEDTASEIYNILSQSNQAAGK